jgi:hypothetical protein
MRPAILLLAAPVLISLLASVVFAKECSIGIYAVIGQVTLGPDGPSPNLVRISGVFVVPVPMSSGLYKSPQRGYLYFRIPPGREQEARKEWKELKAIAGSGQVVGFTSYWVPNPNHSLEVSVHTDGDTAAPVAYPIAHPKGIVKSGDQNDPDFDKIAVQLQNAPHPK